MERTAQDLQQWSNGMIGRVYCKDEKDDKQYRTVRNVQPICEQDSSTVQQLHYWRSARQYPPLPQHFGKSEPLSGTHTRVLLI